MAGAALATSMMEFVSTQPNYQNLNHSLRMQQSTHLLPSCYGQRSLECHFLSVFEIMPGSPPLPLRPGFELGKPCPLQSGTSHDVTPAFMIL